MNYGPYELESTVLETKPFLLNGPLKVSPETASDTYWWHNVCPFCPDGEHIPECGDLFDCFILGERCGPVIWHAAGLARIDFE